MAVLFDYSEYEASHGKAPRGRGGWAFKFRTEDGYVVADEADVERLGRDLAEVHFAPSGTFAEAKRWARAKAKELGAFQVRVCS